MVAEKTSILYLQDKKSESISLPAEAMVNFAVFHTYTANETKIHLREQNIRILLADYQISNAEEIAFLNDVGSDFPELIKIILCSKGNYKQAILTLAQVDAYAFLNKDCEERELLTTLKNADQLDKTRQQLRENKVLQEKTTIELERFIYTLAHDLKSPLNSVKGIINLAKTESEYKGLEYLFMIEKSVQKLDHLLGKNIQYYQNAKVNGSPSEIHFESLIKNTWDSFDGPESKTKIRFQLHSGQTSTFKTDAFRLQIILNTVLSNAIHFQDQNRSDQLVCVNVQTTDHVATLYIEDNGIGLLNEHLSRVFSAFFKADPSKPGSGLGLYMAKEAADRIGAIIELKSRPGQGSVLKIVIPDLNQDVSSQNPKSK
jgi:two-component system sensor histidine kinase/response regulator